jgi:hypothetical protein
MSVIAMTSAVYFRMRMGQIKHQQRGSYIDELYNECRSNMEAIQEAQYAGWGTPGMAVLHNRALLNFMKVRNREFSFSMENIKEWVEFQKTLGSAGMLVGTGEPPQIEAAYIQDIRETQKNMAVWLNKARIHDNNFQY